MEQCISKDYLGTEVVNPLLTDFYQFSMIYAHWKNGRSKEKGVFDLFFRKCPFDMKYATFGGLDECFEFIRNFKITEDHIKFLRTKFPKEDEEFFTYLSQLDMSDIKVYGFQNSDFVIPNEPILTIEGTIDKAQIIETTLLNLVNYPTLIGTLSLRLRQRIGGSKLLIENGSINAQSPNGGLLGVKYAYMSTVDMTTNLMSGKLFHIPMFIPSPKLDESDIDIDIEINEISSQLQAIESKYDLETYQHIIKDIRVTLFSAMLMSNSASFTYEVKSSDNLENEILSFVICSYALSRTSSYSEFTLILNYDSAFQHIHRTFGVFNDLFGKFNIESDSLKLDVLVKYNTVMIKQDLALKDSNIKGLILGPEFIVSSTVPALGCVYKLTEINGSPCIKFSEEKEKQTIPGFKNVIRLFNSNNQAFADFLCFRDEVADYLNCATIKCFLFNDYDTLFEITPNQKKLMTQLLFQEGREVTQSGTPKELQQKVRDGLASMDNSSYKLYISEGIRNFIVQETEKLKEIK